MRSVLVVACLAVASLAWGCESLLGLGEVDYRPVGAGGQGGSSTNAGGQGGTGGAGGQAPVPGALIWSETEAGPRGQRGERVEVDDDGRIFVAGMLDGSVDVPPVRQNAEGSPEALLLALDAEGKRLRSRIFGGKGSVDVSLAVGDPGVFLAGSYRSVDLSPSTGVQLPAPCALAVGELNCGTSDGYAIKYDGEFDLRWARGEGVTGSSETIAGIDLVDGSSPVFLASFRQPQTFFGIPLMDPGNRDAVVVRLTDDDATGPIDWGQRLDNAARDDFPRDLVAGGGQVAALVNTQGTLDERGLDLYVLDAETGNAVWTTPFKVEGHLQGADVERDSQGGYLVAGRLIEATTSGLVLTPMGARDAILMRIDPTGDLSWHVQWPGDVRTLRIAVAPDDTIAVTGTYVGELTIGDTTLPGNPEPNAFVLKLDATGTPLWSHHFRGLMGGAVEMNDVALAPNGDLVAVGSWAGEVDFGFDFLISQPSDDMDRPQDAYDLIVLRYGP